LYLKASQETNSNPDAKYSPFQARGFFTMKEPSAVSTTELFKPQESINASLILPSIILRRSTTLTREAEPATAEFCIIAIH
jgi:hypothetical protein